ncbi:MAG: hypothetical protein RDV48_04585 [Candidatus Eremiobacteraeota bacterium]|nr:hypothetical protein [Candidatus Eremiobacteraeota bacterium]
MKNQQHHLISIEQLAEHFRQEGVDITPEIILDRICRIMLSIGCPHCGKEISFPVPDDMQRAVAFYERHQQEQSTAAPMGGRLASLADKRAAKSKPPRVGA